MVLRIYGFDLELSTSFIEPSSEVNGRKHLPASICASSLCERLICWGVANSVAFVRWIFGVWWAGSNIFRLCSGCERRFRTLAGVEALQLEVGFWDIYIPVDRGGLDAVPGF